MSILYGIPFSGTVWYAHAMDRNDEWLTVQEIADRLKLHEQSIRRWLRSGELHGALLGDRAGYRVRVADLEAFLRQRGWSPQDENDERLESE